MEIYKLSFQDTFLGTLTVDTVTGMSTLSPKDPKYVFIISYFTSGDNNILL